MASQIAAEFREVSIPGRRVEMRGDWTLPEAASGVVLFAHGSGSSRHSPRNRYVAEALQEAGLATLLFDLLTASEEIEDRRTAHLRFDIDLLSRRLVDATLWAMQVAPGLPLGYFGASTGAAAALVAAAGMGERIRAVVSRGGRPDLAGQALSHVTAPTLLIVGGNDPEVLRLNRQAAALLRCPHELVAIPRATHLFEEPGTLEEVARLAAEWMDAHFTQSAPGTRTHRAAAGRRQS
jgi:alpha-beta hydrolase superfamily lysophospholipase